MNLTNEDLEKVASDYVTAGRFMAQGYADEMEKLAAKSELLKTLTKAKSSTKKLAKKAWTKTKNYHKQMASDIKRAATGEGAKGGKVRKSRWLYAGRGALRSAPYTVGIPAAAMLASD